MAKVRLETNDAGGVTGLPSVCTQCGAPATDRRPTTFYWHPQWIGYILLLTLFAGLVFLPLALLLAVLLHKTRQVDVPLCERHRQPWKAQRVALLGGGLLLLLLVAGACTAFALAGPGVDSFGAIGVLLMVFTALYFPVWLVTAAVVAQRSIHATLITDREIKLTAVSRAFANAVLDEEEGRLRGDRRNTPVGRDDGDEPDERVSARRSNRE